MIKSIDLSLIKQAQAGQEKALSLVTERVREIVFPYIHRLTLDHHLSEDLTQETIVDLLRALDRLRIEHTNFFWAWLYRTAFGKVQHHFRAQGNKRVQKQTVTHTDRITEVANREETGPKRLIKQELNQAVFEGMKALNLSYRSILTLRCFDQLSYKEIAKVTGQTEFQARVRFFRAKQSLKKQLLRRGVGRDCLLSALGAFGLATLAPGAKATAAGVVKPAMLEVTSGTILLSVVASKIGIGVMAVVLVAASWTGVSEYRRQKARQSRRQFWAAVNDSQFRFPAQLLAVHDAAGDGWRMCYIPDPAGTIRPINPEQIIVGPRSNNDSRLLIISQDDWLELGFDGTIVDGPGPDLLIDIRRTGALPRIWITDGQGREMELTSNTQLTTGGGFGWVGYELSGVNLPFQASAIRIQGSDNALPAGGLQIWQAKARIR